MTVLHLVHVVAVFLWLGNILAEAVIELARQPNRGGYFTVARLHRSIDAFVELPLIIVILVSGILLLLHTQADTTLWIKIGCALVAIAMNLYCAFFVFRRAKLDEKDENLSTLKSLTWRGVYLSTLIGVPFAIVALYLGIIRLLGSH